MRISARDTCRTILAFDVMPKRPSSGGHLPDRGAPAATDAAHGDPRRRRDDFRGLIFLEKAPVMPAQAGTSRAGATRAVHGGSRRLGDDVIRRGVPRASRAATSRRRARTSSRMEAASAWASCTASWCSASCWLCIALTMIAMNRFRTAKLVSTMNGTKNSQAQGKISMVGRTIPIDQLSSVMIWKQGVHRRADRAEPFLKVRVRMRAEQLGRQDRGDVEHQQAGRRRSRPSRGSPGPGRRTTWRICGTTDISRSTRRIRSARSTENGPLAGTRAMPTTTKSKMFQPERKERQPAGRRASSPVPRRRPPGRPCRWRSAPAPPAPSPSPRSRAPG